jgi:hypothetical protein
LNKYARSKALYGQIAPGIPAPPGSGAEIRVVEAFRRAYPSVQIVFARIVRRLREFLPVCGLPMQWRKSP